MDMQAHARQLLRWPRVTEAPLHHGPELTTGALRALPRAPHQDLRAGEIPGNPIRIATQTKMAAAP